MRSLAQSEVIITQEEFVGVMARVESLRGQMGESTRGVKGLFESLLAQSFDGER